MHLADAFIQSDLHCILCYSFKFYQLFPSPFPLPTSHIYNYILYYYYLLLLQ